MSLITVANKGNYGFYATSLSGVGDSAEQAAARQERIDGAKALVAAIRDAMSLARQTGTSAFSPSDAAVLTMPAMSEAVRNTLFDSVLGRAFSGGPLSLREWSSAVDDLDHWQAAQSSMLAPGAGGGSRNVNGIWYVNGEPWSLSALFTVNRVNTLAEIDRMTADSLNVIGANNETVKALTALMEKLFKKFYENDWDNNFNFYIRVGWEWVDRAGTVSQDSDYVSGLNPWTDGNERYKDDRLLDHQMPFARLEELANKYVGPDSLIAQLRSEGSYLEDNKDTTYGDGAPKGYLKEDFRAMIDEVETIIGALAADNQVAQLRNETLFNSRSNIYEGLSTFLRGQQTTGSTLARNT